MSNTVGFMNTVPEYYRSYTPVSTTASIDRKQEVVFLPDQTLNDFTFKQYSNIVFNIQSGSEILIGSESYLQFDLICNLGQLSVPATGTAGAMGVKQVHQNLQLEWGGGHALFDRVEVRANISSTTIALAEMYNTRYANMSRLMRPVALDRAQFDLDGFSNGNFQSADDNVTVQVIGNRTDVVGSTTLCKDTNAPFTPFLFHPDASSSAVLSITSAAVVSPALTTYTRVKLQLYIPFLLENIPLFLLQNGIQIILSLASPSQSFVYNCTNQVNMAGSDAYYRSFDYVIQNPRYVCTMLRPSEDHIANYTNKFRSSTGLFYYTPAYRVLRNSVINSNNQLNFSMLPGVRSLRSVMGGFFCMNKQKSNMQEKTAVTVGTTPLTDVDENNQVIPFFNYSHIPHYLPTEYYHWRIGSTDFPSRPVYLWNSSQGVYRSQYEPHMIHVLAQRIHQLYGIYNCEMFEYYRTGIRKHQSGTADVGKGLAYPGWFVQDLSRDRGANAPLTGIDCSVTPLEFRIKFPDGLTVTNNGVTNLSKGNYWRSTDTIEFIVFADHDQWVRIGEDGIVILT